MKTFLFLVFILGWGSTSMAQRFTDEEGFTDYSLLQNVILDGTPSQPGDQLLQATVRLNASSSYVSACSGVLIAADVVLTAAHCVAGNEIVSVSFNNKSSYKIGILDKRIYPQYTPEKSGLFGKTMSDHDIALLFLKEKAPSEFYPALLPPKGFSITDEVAVSAGFGMVKKGSFGNNSFPHWAKSSLSISEGKLNVSAHLCGGDSGGPTYVQRKNRLVVIGIHSYGDRDCRFYSGGATDTFVPSYLSWIQREVSQHLSTQAI